MNNEMLIAWAAGLFEGEGYIEEAYVELPNGRKSPRIRLAISMTDEDVMNKFCEVVGCGKIKGPYGPYRNGNKEIWKWEISKKKDVKRILKSFNPFFGQRRLKKSQKVLIYITEWEKSSAYLMKGIQKLPSGRFFVTCRINRTYKGLGTYDTAEEASLVYNNYVESVS